MHTNAVIFCPQITRIAPIESLEVNAANLNALT